MRQMKMVVWVLVLIVLGCADLDQESNADYNEGERQPLVAATRGVERFEGQYHFHASRGCGTITFRDDGRVSALDSGFCDFGSAIECGAERCTFTCLSETESDVVMLARMHRPGIFEGSAIGLRDVTTLASEEEIEEGDNPFDRRDPMASQGFLFERLSDCITTRREWFSDQ